MAHRRKSSHPVCKTRRNQGSSWEAKQADTDEESYADQDDISRSPRSDQEKAIAIETDSESGQHIMIPPDLYKDFEAVRSQTKMDTTDLMRRLLKDYQSIATGKATTSDDPGESDYNNTSVSLASKASIASDVSLATTRVDDEDEFQGLDLTVKPSRRIDSRLFDTKSLNCESYEEQPLDLTCTKPPLDGSSRESPSSSQIDINTVNNEFNYVYVYPGLYPPNSGLMGQDDMPCESPKGDTSPVPDLISPTEVSSFETPVQNQFMSSNMAIEPSLGLMNPSMAYHSLMSSMTKGPLSPDIPDDSPRSTPLASSIKSERPGNERGQSKQFKKGVRPGPRALPLKVGKGKERKPPEMKVISENTAYPGVYTSVMKLPWSRRTRTKKPKHKVKLEDTLVPQFMIEQEQLENQAREEAALEPMMGEMKFDPIASIPESSSSVMMVYPNATASSQGKPVRKRGRPPKLPMLAKLLQHQQNQKRMKKEKDNAVKVEPDPAQQTVTNGGMVLYNASQILQAFGIPVPGGTPGQEQAQPTVLPNMSQAQLIGQFPLSQFTGGPIQFLGQFPASSIPLQGQTAIQPMPMMVQEDGQLTPQVEVKGNVDQTSTSKDIPIKPAIPTVNYQYAFQPMIIPASVQTQVPVSSATANYEESIKDDTVIKNENLIIPKQECIEIDPVNPDGLITSSSNIKTHEGSSIVSSMNTTSISDAGSGAIYQEMILSSKSLVDVKKRKRQTAIQLLKSKSSDQNFLCTSFRIRPRLVAQAQAQRERQAAKSEVDGLSEIESFPKNLNSPQNDSDNHFGEKQLKQEFDMSTLQIKREVDMDEMCDDMSEYSCDSNQLVIDTDAFSDSVQVKTEPVDEFEDTTIAQKPNSTKRFMLRGSQKRKAKGLKSKIINDICKKARQVVCNSQINRGKDSSVMDIKEHEVLTNAQNEMYQELFNCKFCNKIIPVDQMEVHSLEHIQRKSSYRCENCGSNFESIETKENENPTCTICRYTLTSNSDAQIFTRYGHGKIACDECPEAFKSLPEFYEHKTEVHKNDNALQGDFECDFCGKTYQYYHALQFHRRTHRERRVPCLDKTCSTRFRSRKEMELHFDAKHPDKKEYFHCVYDGCSKKFLKNFHLQEHIRVKHYNIRAFQCPWPGCIKEFAARRHLKIHLLIHRDEKPMKCDHCEYRCRQRSAMNWHMRKHPDVPYKYKRSSPSVSTTESD